MPTMQEWEVLVVEDELDGQEVVEGILEVFGVACDHVTTAEEGLNRLDEHYYTVVVCDLHLPNMDGIDFIEAIRDNPSLQDIPCIAVTAYHTTEVKQQALDAGFDAYLPKPLDDTSFVRELERIVNRN